MCIRDSLIARANMQVDSLFMTGYEPITCSRSPLISLSLIHISKGIGAKGLAYVRWADAEPNATFKKFFTPEQIMGLMNKLGAQQGDVVMIVADKDSVVLPTLGALRLKVAKTLDIIPEGWNFLWITEFPFFEYDEESGKWIAMHHPFTMPQEECIQLSLIHI